MSDEINYRPATIKDLDTLVSLQEKLARSHEDIDKFYSLQVNFQKQVKKFFTEHLASKNSMFYLAQSGGKIVGYIFCTYKEGIPIFKYKKQAAVTDMFVEPEFRRRGVAKRLFLEAKRFGKRVSADFVVLDVDVSNTAAIGLYTKNGLKPLMTRMIMRVE